MYEQFFAIIQFMLDAFGKTWPYLLATIPLAVAVQLSGASRYIQRAFQAQPVAAIFLATLVGAFSPFCSCSVIPLVAALLIGGVPLGPVMAFWIASPSMDPEIFFLSVAMVGWELAVWRLGGTLVLSLSAGFITHLLIRRGWLDKQILRTQHPPRVFKPERLLLDGLMQVKARWIMPLVRYLRFRLTAQPGIVCCAVEPAGSAGLVSIYAPDPDLQLNLVSQPGVLASDRTPGSAPARMAETGCSACSSSTGRRPARLTWLTNDFLSRLFKETGKALLLVVQFMALAYFLEALITLHVPQAWIAGLLGQHNRWAIAIAAMLGVPVYTSNLTALPLISGLLAQGMQPAAALAFLIAGPTTTLPAMSAVWGLVSRRVFALYVAFSLLGALALGYLYQIAALVLR